MTREEALFEISSAIGTLDDNNSDEAFRNALADKYANLVNEVSQHMNVWLSEEGWLYLNFQSHDLEVDGGVIVDDEDCGTAERAVKLRGVLDGVRAGMSVQGWIVSNNNNNDKENEQ